MKKYFVMAAVAAIVASCTNNDADLTTVDTTGLEPVSLGLSNGATVTVTRGTGTVGDPDVKKNAWNNEDIYILMTTNDSRALENSTDEWGYTWIDQLKEQFDGTFWARPTASTDSVSLNYCIDEGNVGKTTRYYPNYSDCYSQFFGFYIDDAIPGYDKVTKENERPEITVNGKRATTEFVMNGSQDIMAGYAVTYTKNEETGVITKDSLYSAKTSRDHIVPVLKMKHQLTRFTFEIVNGDPDCLEDSIKSITVQSAYKGTLTVAYDWDNAPESLIQWDDEVTNFDLKNSKELAAPMFDGGKGMVKDYKTDNNEDSVCLVKDGKDLGAMFVKPGQISYPLIVKLSQPVEAGKGYFTQSLKLDITKGNGTVFEQGKSYHVKIKVYGMQKIEVTAVLEPWIDGGEITLGDDDNPIIFTEPED